MTKQGQDNHNMPSSVRLWGRYDYIPLPWELEKGMEEANKAKETTPDPNIIPFKDENK